MDLERASAAKAHSFAEGDYAYHDDASKRCDRGVIMSIRHAWVVLRPPGADVESDFSVKTASITSSFKRKPRSWDVAEADAADVLAAMSTRDCDANGEKRSAEDEPEGDELVDDEAIDSELDDEEPATAAAAANAKEKKKKPCTNKARAVKTRRVDVYAGTSHIFIYMRALLLSFL